MTFLSRMHTYLRIKWSLICWVNSVALGRSVELKLFLPNVASVWHQRDIPEPRPSPRYGQSQLFLDDHHVLVMGGLGGPNNVFNDVWLLDMEPGKELENSIDGELLENSKIS